MINAGMIFFSLPLAISLLLALKFFLEFGSTKKQSFIQPSYKLLTSYIFFTTLLSFGFLVNRFAVSDFSYQIVFQNSHTLKPLFYKIAAVWANHEGSMLLFVTIFTAYSYAYSKLSKYELKDEVLGFQAAVLFLILAYTYFTSNPFEPIASELAGVADGMGLNPLLQDFGLAIHPPMLYIGYAGFSLAFSTALVVLRNEVTNKSWADFIRPWILFSWSVLSIGVMLGAWWAYRELGWGGFWFWDPVENVSLLPWLFGSALIHGIYCTKKFNRFAAVSIVLALITFLSSLVGFFLVRSGVLSSVHTFASDPTRGIFMLAIVFVIASYAAILGGKKLFKMKFSVEGNMHFISREIFMMFMIILMVVMAITIMLGIFYPMILEIFFQRKISVGEPYFNAVFIPIALVLIIIMVFAPTLKWQRERLWPLVKKALFSFIASFAIAVYLKLNFAQVTNFLAFAIFASLWLTISHPEVIIRRLLKKEKVSKGFTAMIISHTAFGLLAFAISLLITFELDTQVNLKRGESAEFEGYSIRLDDSRIIKGSNFMAQKTDFLVKKGENEIAKLSPENRIYFPGLNKTHEAEIEYGFLKDIYVVMGQTEGKNIKNYVFPTRIYIKPFIFFIWFSVVLMAFGGFLALLPKKK